MLRPLKLGVVIFLLFTVASFSSFLFFTHFLIPQTLSTFPQPSNLRNIVLQIDSKKANCTGVAPMKCLRVRKQAENEWEYFYSSIQGFEYEPGYIYFIEVSTRKILNPPADGSSIEYSLVKIISKEPDFQLRL